MELTPDSYGVTCPIGSKGNRKKASLNRGELGIELTVERKVLLRLPKLQKEKRGLSAENSARQAIYNHRVLVRVQTLS